MNSVKIDKTQLMEKLIENRAEHRARYIEVNVAWRAKVVDELNDIVSCILGGDKKFKTRAEAIQPVDHTSDYDKAILMLEYSTDDIIELSSHEFDQYIQDEWDWSNSFGETYAAYTQ